MSGFAVREMSAVPVRPLCRAVAGRPGFASASERIEHSRGRHRACLAVGAALTHVVQNKVEVAHAF